MKRARSILAVVAAGVAALVVSGVASAHLPGARMCGSLPAKQELACGRHAYFHGLGVVTWIRENASRTLQSGKVQVSAQFAGTYADHLWLMKAGRRWISEARTRLAPRAPSAASVGHWALWSCITNGAYPGAYHEGNGYNGAYSGPLGMTTPWAGYVPTGGDWVHTPLAVVYGDAEREWASRGYSISWLEGQWPQTAPPCVAKMGLG